MNTATASLTAEPNTPHTDHEVDHELDNAARAGLKMGWGQKAVVTLLLTVVLAPPFAGFYSYFSGVPLHLFAAKKDEEDKEAEGSTGIKLVQGQPHTLEISDGVASTLGIRKGDQDAVGVAEAPSKMRPLVLPGSTALDPTRLARIRARFVPARVVEIAHVRDASRVGGATQFREVRQGDTVFKGDHLATFYSLDVGSKKNDLLDSLVQLELDQKVLDEAEKHAEAVPDVFLRTELRAVEGDRNAINRAINNLKLWEIPQEEIDALHAEAKKITADKGAWLKTPEGRWVKGEKHADRVKVDHAKGADSTENDDAWGRVTLRVPFDGVVVERSLHVDEMVVDNTVNLLQIADVSRLLVIANCPEDSLPALEGLSDKQRRWTVKTVGAGSAAGLSGTIDEIGYIIDPNQHTAIIKGYVDNPGKHMRAGQYVAATVNIPPPDDVVEIAVDALVDDGRQSLVFVQTDPVKRHYTMRRVHVTHRFEHTVFVRSTDIPKEEQFTALEAEENLLPQQPLHAGEHVLLAGPVELKRVVMDLESRRRVEPSENLARAKAGSTSDIESPSEQKQKAGKG